MSQIAYNKNSAREAAMMRRRVQYSNGKAGLDQMSNGVATQSSTMAQTAKPASGAMASRDASKARRQAMANGGKAAVIATDRIRGETYQASSKLAAPDLSTSAESKQGCGCGCDGTRDECKTAMQASSPLPTLKSRPMVRKAALPQNTVRAAQLARRQAMSVKGKSAIKTDGPTAAQSARASNPGLSGRELAQQVRDQQKQKGKISKTSQSNGKPCGRMRPAKNANAAEDAPWKVGASETSHGQILTGTMVGRSERVTGDEPSTCRAVTGTEYLGADIFRQFCQDDVKKTPSKVQVTRTSNGNAVSGNELGRSKKVTGNEPGTCKQVTGNEYVSDKQTDLFCSSSGSKAKKSTLSSAGMRSGTSRASANKDRTSQVTGHESGQNRELTGTPYTQRNSRVASSNQAPAKVGISETLRGGKVSGTLLGRSEHVTGDEPGSCRNVTGDEYTSQEQYKTFCNTAPSPSDYKVGVSKTVNDKQVTGTLTDRNDHVTGNEPGTCKAVTGTPYASANQFTAHCDSDAVATAAARTRRQRYTSGAMMTGIQPGIDSTTTGNQKGRCEPVSGTPYVGADQLANVCPSTPAEPNSPDFPQTLANAPWGQFSTTAPNHAAQSTESHSAVTGSRYEQGTITGPFGMATGKVTGTEEARFNGSPVVSKPVTNMPASTAVQDDRAQSRISGEGMDGGTSITGDDWNRGKHVTGTEGLSATRRNPTRRGGSAIDQQQTPKKRNTEIAAPTSKVTGGSGNTDKGALITYSGGARG